MLLGKLGGTERWLKQSHNQQVSVRRPTKAEWPGWIQKVETFGSLSLTPGRMYGGIEQIGENAGKLVYGQTNKSTAFV